MERPVISRGTWILLAAFALLLLVFFALRSREEVETDVVVPTPVPAPALFSFGTDEVVGIRVSNLDGEVVELVKEGEIWRLLEPAVEDGETDQTQVDGLLASIPSLKLVTEVQLDAPLEVMGLAEPSFHLTLTLMDGEMYELAIGDAAVTNAGYYVMLDGGEPRLVTKSVLDRFLGLLDNPPLLPTPIPEGTATPEDVFELTATPEVSPEP